MSPEPASLLSTHSLLSLLSLRRKRLGWSQQKLAARAGLSLPGIQLLESGRANPSWSTLQAVATALGIEVLLRERKPTWQDWAELGVPVESGARMGCVLSRQEWIDRMSAALAGLAASELGAPDVGASERARLRDALGGLLMAVRDHYPKVFGELARGEGFAALSRWTWNSLQRDPGRMLKLRRIALANLAEVL